ncbi:MAG: DUF302 domain-containing protein [Thiobacillus sp.]
MFKKTIAVLSLALLAPQVHADAGLITHSSAHSAKVSLDRLEARAKENEMTIFTRIDHAVGAKSINQELRPTEVLIFGHPKGGTMLMKCTQEFGVDLPMRVLAWEDEMGKTWLSYRDPASLGHNYSNPMCGMALKRMSSKLDELVKSAAE